MAEYKVIGLMSGTSLDGLDVCCVTFTQKASKWLFKIEAAETIHYPAYILNALVKAPTMSAFDFVLFDKQYGKYIGIIVNQFISKHKCVPDFIASHGHTIFHQPEKHITYQIGDGIAIAVETRLEVICDFRSMDVALGGQGAPLVPIGDRLLFSEYDYCLNIGGFANISFESDNKRIAFDICPANIVLNYYAQKAGAHYDKGGGMALQGTVCELLLDKLNNLDFYQNTKPKSLGREWVEHDFLPIFDSYKISLHDKLATACEHAAVQIARCAKKGKLLITGGGAYNTHLINRIKHYSDCEIIIPDNQTIDFKEALIFAFLGVLHKTNQINCLSSVTGAAFDNIGGTTHKVYDISK